MNSTKIYHPLLAINISIKKLICEFYHQQKYHDIHNNTKSLIIFEHLLAMMKCWTKPAGLEFRMQNWYIIHIYILTYNLKIIAFSAFLYSIGHIYFWSQWFWRRQNRSDFGKVSAKGAEFGNLLFFPTTNSQHLSLSIYCNYPSSCCP